MIVTQHLGGKRRIRVQSHFPLHSEFRARFNCYMKPSLKNQIKRKRINNQYHYHQQTTKIKHDRAWLLSSALRRQREEVLANGLHSEILSECPSPQTPVRWQNRYTKMYDTSHLPGAAIRGIYHHAHLLHACWVTNWLITASASQLVFKRQIYVFITQGQHT